MSAERAGDEEEKTSECMFKFYVGHDGHGFTPAGQFYVFPSDNEDARRICSERMSSFRDVWTATNSNAPLREVSGHFHPPLEIDAGFWTPEYDGKSLCSEDRSMLPASVREALKTLEDYEKAVEDHVVSLNEIKFNFINHIEYEGTTIELGDDEFYKGSSLKSLLSFQPPVKVRKTLLKGYGLFATDVINEGVVLFQYTGELLSMAKAEERYSQDDVPHAYLFNAGDSYFVDAVKYGNYSRFINHICDGRRVECNVRVEPITTNGTTPTFDRLLFVSSRRIEVGQELLFNYRAGTQKRLQQIVCRCPCDRQHEVYPWIF